MHKTRLIAKDGSTVCAYCGRYVLWSQLIPRRLLSHLRRVKICPSTRDLCGLLGRSPIVLCSCKVCGTGDVTALVNRLKTEGFLVAEGEPSCDLTDGRGRL